MSKKSFSDIAKRISAGKGKKQDVSVPKISIKSVGEMDIPKMNIKTELSERDSNKDE